MARRSFVRAAASLMLGRGARRARRPNLLLIVVDALRADHLGCYGSAQGLTPAMDRLAQHGTLFSDVMSASPTTGASHATLMTGTYPTRHTVVYNDGTIPDSLPCLAQVCREAGYATAAFVSNEMLRPGYLAGIDRGFDAYDVDLPALERNRSAAYRDARDTVAAATRWLDANSNRPFLIWTHLMEPHGPYDVPEEALLDEVRHVPEVPGEPSTLPVGADNIAPGSIPRYQVLGSERRPAEYRRRYAARVKYVDRCVGQLLDELAKQPGETLVVLTADHGELLGEHGYYFQHGITLSQPVLRVPLLFAGAGVPVNRRVQVPVGHADLMPTLLDLLGLSSDAARARVQGRSLSALLKRRRGGRPAPIYAMCAVQAEWTVRHGSLKYLRSEWGDTGRDGLFDVAADPREEHDLSRDRPSEAKRLDDLLLRLKAENPDLLSAVPAASADYSEEQRERLRSLGYLD